MSTTLTTPTATTTTSSRRRVARVLTGLLLTLGSVLGITATNAAPAQAASYVEGCFSGGTGSYWGTAYQVQAYWQGSWYTIFNGTLDRNNCAYVNIGTANRQYPLRLYVYQRVGTALFTGVSPYNAPVGSGRWNVGTGYISCYGCR
jgi:hypothetical protein